MDKFKVSVGAVDHQRYLAGSYLQELHRTAKLIHTEFKNDLVIFLSGGTDSEVVVRNFVAIGLKPDCYVIRFANDFNSMDVMEAMAICRELDLKLHFIDFDVQDFLYSGEATELGKKVQCTQLTYLMVYKCILAMGRPAIMGGEVVLTRNVGPSPSYWYYTFRENEDASAMRFSKQFNIPFVNEYFSYTPELLLHYLQHPDIQHLVSDKFNYKLSSVSSKNSILRKLYPGIRIKTKTHGFEKLMGFNFQAAKEIAFDQIKRLEPSIDGMDYLTVLNKLKGL